MKLLVPPQSGSIAGQTASRNRFGQYMRTRAVPVNPNTPAQSNMRSILGACATNWGGLSDANKAAWSAWAAMHPQTDSLGQTVFLTGAMAFNKVNCLLVMMGRSAVSSPPADPLPDAPNIVSAALNIEAGDWDSATITLTPSPVPSGQAQLLYCSPPKGQGTTFNGDFRYLSFIPASGTSPFDISSLLTAKWGTPQIGVAFYFRSRVVADDGGMSMFSNVLRVVTTG